MPRLDSLGQFEQLVLTAILALRDNAYGVTIHAKVQELARPKSVSLGAVYVTLDRLEDKGFVASWLSDPTPERGGRAKRCYRLEALGERALQESAVTAKRIWDGIAEVWGRNGSKSGASDDERDELMRSGPPRIIEKLFSLALPPACREEVLGDLYEACDSPGQYIREALRVIPMVILSRIRRTSDSQVLLMQATALYLSFMGAAWYEEKSFLFEDSGLLRLTIPPAWVLFGLTVDDAYARPGKRSMLKQMRGPGAWPCIRLPVPRGFVG